MSAHSKANGRKRETLIVVVRLNLEEKHATLFRNIRVHDNTLEFLPICLFISLFIWRILAYLSVYLLICKFLAYLNICWSMPQEMQRSLVQDRRCQSLFTSQREDYLNLDWAESVTTTKKKAHKTTVSSVHTINQPFKIQSSRKEANNN